MVGVRARRLVLLLVCALAVASGLAGTGEAVAAGERALELQFGDDPARGSARAPLALIEFTDYREFRAESSIFHTDSEIDFNGEEKPPPEETVP